MDHHSKQEQAVMTVLLFMLLVNWETSQARPKTGNQFVLIGEIRLPNFWFYELTNLQIFNIFNLENDLKTLNFVYM